MRKSSPKTQQLFLDLQGKMCCPTKKCAMNYHHTLFFGFLKIIFVGKMLWEPEGERKKAEINTFYFQIACIFQGILLQLKKKKSTLLLPVSWKVTKGMVTFFLISILAVMWTLSVSGSWVLSVTGLWIKTANKAGKWVSWLFFAWMPFKNTMVFKMSFPISAQLY